MVLLLLLSNRPSLAIGALAIGLHNSGVMGRLLLEGLQQQSGQRQDALRAMGSSERISWLYGLLSPQSPSYLVLAAVMLLLEQLLRLWRKRSGVGVHGQRRMLLLGILAIVLGVIGTFWLRLIVPDQF